MTDYLKQNPQYVITVAIVFCVLFSVCLLTLIFKRTVFSQKRKKSESEQGTENTEPTRNSDKTDFSVPEAADVTAEQPSPQRVSTLSEMLKKTFDSNEETQDSDDNFEPLSTSYMEEENAHDEQFTLNTDIKEGAWRIFLEEGNYFGELRDAEDAVLLKTQMYSAAADVKTAIDGIAKNVGENNFAVSVVGAKFVFKLYSPTNRLVCTGEPCDSKAECELAIKKVKAFVSTAQIIRG